MPTKPTYYIHDTSNGIVTESLMREKNDDFEKIEIHPEMECFVLSGHLVELALYEVPSNLMVKLRRMRAKGGFQFREFVSHKSDGSLPSEVSWGDAKTKYLASPAMKFATKRLKELKRKRRVFQGVH